MHSGRNDPNYFRLRTHAYCVHTVRMFDPVKVSHVPYDSNTLAHCWDWVYAYSSGSLCKCKQAVSVAITFQRTQYTHYNIYYYVMKEYCVISSRLSSNSDKEIRTGNSNLNPFLRLFFRLKAAGFQCKNLLQHSLSNKPGTKITDCSNSKTSLRYHDVSNTIL